MSGTTERLVKQLAAGVDLERVIEELRLSPTQAVNLLCGAKGRRIMAARRRLAKIHADIVTSRFSSYAVHRVCELLSSDKPELRLKGALTVIGLAGLGKKSRRGSAKKVTASQPTPEELQLIESLARLMNPAEEVSLEVLAKALPAGAAGPEESC